MKQRGGCMNTYGIVNLQISELIRILFFVNDTGLFAAEFHKSFRNMKLWVDNGLFIHLVTKYFKVYYM